jgi:hypothetical protein
MDWDQVRDEKGEKVCKPSYVPVKQKGGKKANGGGKGSKGTSHSAASERSGGHAFHHGPDDPWAGYEG